MWDGESGPEGGTVPSEKSFNRSGAGGGAYICDL